MYGRHHRPWAHSNQLLWPTPQACDSTYSVDHVLTERFVAETLEQGNPQVVTTGAEIVQDFDVRPSLLLTKAQWLYFFGAWRRRLAERDHNIRVANCTTPANFFHLLREQIHRPFLKPLIAMAPKWLHTHRHCRSRLADMSTATYFHRVIADQEVGDNMPTDFTSFLSPPKETRRLVFCSGKLFYHLAGARRHRKAADVRFVRIEQIAPFPYDDFVRVVLQCPSAELVWAQEEPKNMGAWAYVAPRARTALSELASPSADHNPGRQNENGPRLPELRYVGRAPSAAPAAGSMGVHQAEMRDIINEVFRGD